jgi:hypothetical protein
LKKKILILEKNKENLLEVFIEKNTLSNDENFPILESLVERKILNDSDMLSIFSNYKKTKNLRFSLE